MNEDESRAGVADTTTWDREMESLNASPVDPEGWNRLLDLAKGMGDIARVEKTYDEMLVIYPDAAAVQLSYVSYLMQHGQSQSVEAVFRRCLLDSPSVDLWKLYLAHVRENNEGPQSLAVIHRAFNFALRRIGHDKDSGGIWLDYLRLIQEGEPSTSQHLRVRVLYQRAICVPLANIDLLWQDYVRFERGVDPVTASSFVEQHKPHYMKARSILHRLQSHLDTIHFRSAASELLIQLPTRPIFSVADRTLVGAWKGYLRWEESNPLEFDDNNVSARIARIRSAYRKALACMRFFPEIWYMAYRWLVGVNMLPQAEQLLKDGIFANPASFVLNFAYAEALEVKGTEHFPTIHSVFKAFLTVLREDLDTRRANADRESEQRDVHSSVKDIADRQDEYGVVWVMYMRFARRAEGTQAGRDVFREAREDKHVTWQVYEAAAGFEYHSTQDVAIATRIYQKGLDIFRDKADYIVHYLDFLLSINDERSAGALFYDSVQSLPPSEARPLWERWVRHKYRYGDLASALALEKSMSDVYPKERDMKHFAQRHMSNGLDTIAARDLGFAHNSHQASHSVARIAPREHDQKPEDPGITGSHNSRTGHSAGHKRARGTAPPEGEPPSQRKRAELPYISN